MNEQVTKYISEAPEEQAKMMETLRIMIHKAVPNVVESIKWGRPVFSTDTDFAYFKTAKAYLTLGFFKVAKLSTNLHLLEGTGKDMRHIKIKKTGDIPTPVIKSWLGELTR